MKPFKFFWDTHKWTGIVLSVVLLNVAITGFLLLIKKKADWIQPPTQVGAPGEWQDLAPLSEVLQTVFAQGHEDFRTIDDVDRIDFRPGKRVHKVRSKHHHSEMQVDAMTGQVLGVATRRSDLLEQIHDGSFFGNWVHDWAMLLVPPGLVFLVASGFYLWLAPILRRRRTGKAKRQKVVGGGV